MGGGETQTRLTSPHPLSPPSSLRSPAYASNPLSPLKTPLLIPLPIIFTLTTTFALFRFFLIARSAAPAAIVAPFFAWLENCITFAIVLAKTKKDQIFHLAVCRGEKKANVQEAQCAHAPSLVRSAFASHSGHLTILDCVFFFLGD